MTAPPPEVIAERDMESFSVAGRSGDIVRDNGRYKNVHIPYECALLPQDNRGLRQSAVWFVNALGPNVNYQRLEDTYNPQCFRMGRVSGALNVKSIVERAGTFTITFDCKPQRFLKSGEIPIFLLAPDVLYNQYAFTALPLITVHGSGAGTLTVGNITVEIKAMDGHIVFDSDLQNAYRVADSGTLENMNGSIRAPVYPELRPGENVVSWTGDITGVEIIPRWWTL